MKRADGIKLRHAEPLYTVATHFMTKRSDAMNMITLDIPVKPMNSYLNDKRKDGVHISHLACVISAFVRTASQHPGVNRFIVNKRAFARNELTIGMVVLKEGEKTEGTMSKMTFELTDTIYDVNKKINDYVTQNRATENENSTDKVIKLLLKAPGFVRFGVNVLRWLDKHGCLPKKVIDISPFHTTMVITNLASIKTNHIYHHVYDFGTTSISLAMGNQREIVKSKNGVIEPVKCIPMGVVMDERICSGSYFAYAFRDFQKYLKNPIILETPPEKVIEDPEI